MASFPVNASFGKRDNKVALQAIKHLLSEVDVRQKQHVGSPWRHAEDSPLTTMLDRIQVISVKDGKRTAIWFRLIGPGRSLNLELAAPRSSLYRSVMRISMKPIPELYRDLIEVEARTRCCFGDLYDFIKQYGFHRWTFPQQCSGQTADECLSWAYVFPQCLITRRLTMRQMLHHCVLDASRYIRASDDRLRRRPARLSRQSFHDQTEELGTRQQG